MKSRMASAVAPCSSPALIHRRVTPTVGGVAGDLESKASASFARGVIGAGGALGVLGVAEGAAGSAESAATEEIGVVAGAGALAARARGAAGRG
jgi:hypothetical protein